MNMCSEDASLAKTWVEKQPIQKKGGRLYPITPVSTLMVHLFAVILNIALNSYINSEIKRPETLY